MTPPSDVVAQSTVAAAWVSVAACDALPRVTALRLAENAINTEHPFPVSAANRTRMASGAVTSHIDPLRTYRRISEVYTTDSNHIEKA
jgi:hypothetical protein